MALLHAGWRGAAAEIVPRAVAALGSELLTSTFPLCERLVERSYGVLVLTRFMQPWLERMPTPAGLLVP